MARFRFRPQPALDLAARREEAAHRGWSLAGRALAAAAAALREIEARLEGERLPLPRGAAAGAAWLQLVEARRGALASVRSSAAGEVARCERELALRRASLEGAMRGRRALERLRDRRRAEHSRREALGRERELDEANEHSTNGGRPPFAAE
jgi:flagellar FliJ protein